MEASIRGNMAHVHVLQEANNGQALMDQHTGLPYHDTYTWISHKMCHLAEEQTHHVHVSTHTCTTSETELRLLQE